MNNENISNFDTIPIDLFIPDKIKLATVVKNELSTSFGEVTAEWVDCPDLTQEPFNLAAPGLGGDATLLDIGGTANIFPFRQLKIYDFKNILNQLNRSQNNNFIIGGGLSTQPMTLNYGHLIMNGTFAPVANEIIAVSNKSRFAFRNRFNDQGEEEQFALEILNNPFSKCHMYGNFFVSQGLREQVLKVEAKERTGHDFIEAIQRGISRIFPSKLFSNLIVVQL
ncbi:ester hydrolase C11orf54 homolog [Pogonomyrmex barbatus]|uniref:Ester hydrolase C11orf54 homolog n=1 Tax=Pogonomyrmex barbatus TaxID=144034 RepID=A0A6I9W3F4_9HYME|nr:ester hydrolase C11orf54 homolog [Pogonomyrmex barbatus]